MLYVRKSRINRACYYCGKTIEPKQARFICNCFNTTKDKQICYNCVEKILTAEIKGESHEK